MGLRYKHISGFLTTSSGRWSKAFSYAGLAIGILLLLASIQVFVDLQKLLGKTQQNKPGFDYIPLSKQVTNESMGQPQKNMFTQEEIDDIKRQSFISDAAPLLSSQFHVQASAGTVIPFSTDLFLEAVDQKFIDTVPSDFKWHEGQMIIPIIFSSEYLDIYNIFAPGQGYPQVSEKTLASIQIFIICSGRKGTVNFRAEVAGLTSRVNSILVPQNFLEWANKNIAGVTKPSILRVIVKIKDANDPAFIDYIDKHEYRVNKELIKTGRVKKVIELVLSGIAIFGVLVILLALMLFAFYLQLIVAKSRDNLRLLILLGYAPRWLGKTVAGRWIPIHTLIIVISLLITALFQWMFYNYLITSGNQLSPFIHWSVLLVAIILIFLTAILNSRLIRTQLYSLEK